jgi:hypothetical protein
MKVKYIIDNSNEALVSQTINGGLSVTSNITGSTIYSEALVGDGSQVGGVVGLTYSDMGFTITSTPPSTVNQNVVLPYNSTVEYPTPLTIDSGFSVTVPAGTTLTII